MTAAHDDWRLELRVRKRALRDYMQYRGETVRSLADKVDVTKSTIGNMHSLNPDRGVFCPPALARRIEEVLQSPPGFIFEPKVARVVDNEQQRRAA